jgi:hypothetical protein
VTDPYDASATVPDVMAVFRRWRAWSDEVRASTLHARDLRYGPTADETLDLLVPPRWSSSSTAATGGGCTRTTRRSWRAGSDRTASRRRS